MSTDAAEDAPAGARSPTTAFLALVALTAAELAIFSAGVERTLRITALVGLLMAKAAVVLTLFMRARASRRAARLTLAAFADGGRLHRRAHAGGRLPGAGPMIVARVAIALGLLLVAGPAWALCPNCLGQSPSLSSTLRLVGVFLLVPPAVFFAVAVTIRRLCRQSAPPSLPPSLPPSGAGGDQGG